MRKRGQIGVIIWGIILTLNLITATAWKLSPSMRPEGMSRGEAEIIWAIFIIGCALFVLLERKLYAND